jgi:hypothetical protein
VIGTATKATTNPNLTIQRDTCAIGILSKNPPQLPSLLVDKRVRARPELKKIPHHLHPNATFTTEQTASATGASIPVCLSYKS